MIELLGVNGLFEHADGAHLKVLHRGAQVCFLCEKNDGDWASQSREFVLNASGGRLGHVVGNDEASRAVKVRARKKGKRRWKVGSLIAQLKRK